MILGRRVFLTSFRLGVSNYKVQSFRAESIFHTNTAFYTTKKEYEEEELVSESETDASESETYASESDEFQFKTTRLEEYRKLAMKMVGRERIPEEFGGIRVEDEDFDKIYDEDSDLLIEYDFDNVSETDYEVELEEYSVSEAGKITFKNKNMGNTESNEQHEALLEDDEDWIQRMNEERYNRKFINNINQMYHWSDGEAAEVYNSGDEADVGPAYTDVDEEDVKLFPPPVVESPEDIKMDFREEELLVPLESDELDENEDPVDNTTGVYADYVQPIAIDTPDVVLPIGRFLFFFYYFLLFFILFFIFYFNFYFCYSSLYPFIYY